MALAGNDITFPCRCTHTGSQLTLTSFRFALVNIKWLRGRGFREIRTSRENQRERNKPTPRSFGGGLQNADPSTRYTTRLRADIRPHLVGYNLNSHPRAIRNCRSRGHSDNRSDIDYQSFVTTDGDGVSSAFVKLSPARSELGEWGCPNRADDGEPSRECGDC
jgi:hypothetical protein